MRSYTDLEGLAEVVLEESCVLNVEAQPGRVVFEMDFALTPQHPEYTAPPASERDCFRRGTLRLHGVRRLTWDNQGAPPATDASGETDYGHIDSFEWQEGRFVLSGDWGRLDLQAEDVEVSLTPGIALPAAPAFRNDPRGSVGKGERRYYGDQTDEA